MVITDLPNPYDGFNASAYPLDLQGWGSDSPVFKELIAEKRPELIIEVGSWKGGSAVTMANAVKELGLNTKIICVDTFLGALEFWTDLNDPDRFLSLNLKHGWPQVYYQFLANMVHTGHQDIVFPLPQTSLIAARWFYKNNIKADMIYIDASHDEPDVHADLCAYWGNLKDGGILFGDDYDTWEGVRKAVSAFPHPHSVHPLGRHWTIRK